MSAPQERTDWYYNGADGRLPAFRTQLPISLEAADSNAKVFIQRATVTNTRGQTCVANRAHAYMIANNLLTLGTWENPFPITGPTPTDCARAVAHAEISRQTLHSAALAGSPPQAHR